VDDSPVASRLPVAAAVAAPEALPELADPELLDELPPLRAPLPSTSTANARKMRAVYIYLGIKSL